MALKQQSKLQQYFQSFRNSNDSAVVQIDKAGAAADADNNREGLKRSAEDECKENKPPGTISSMSVKKQPTGSSGTSKPLGRSSKQMFLDLGQKDFSASKCSVCGMVYAKGHEEDEKLHKSIHQNVVQGLKFQGWGQERVVLADPFTGRLLMVMPSDPAAHVKRAQEVCGFVEKAHGITPGWLMSAKQCKVFLFVSLQKRIVGLAVVEPIKQAYKVAAAGTCDEEADSSQPTQQQQSLSTHSQTFQQIQQQRQQQNQQQPRPLLWPGLHRSGSSSGRRPAGLRGGNSLLLVAGAGTAADSTAGGSSAVKADSCPPSLLEAAGHMQMDSSMTVAEPTQQQQQQGNDPQQQQQQQASSVSNGSVCHGPGRPVPYSEGSGQQMPAEQQLMLAVTGQASSQQQQQQQQCEMPPPTAQPAAAAGGRSGGGSRSIAGGCGSGSLLLSSGKSASSTGKAAAVAAPAASGGGGSGGGRNSSKSYRTAGLSGGSAGGSCVLADRSKALRAMLGVRMVWVSAEQRRRGMATKLLDAVRCNMVPGYVVPRNQMAFMQPTEEGSKLAASFTGAQQFLLYGIE